MVETCEHSSLSHIFLFILLSLLFYSHSLSFCPFLSLFPVNTHSLSIQLSITPIPCYRSLHIHSLYHWVGDDRGVNYSIHSLIHYSYSCVTISLFILSTTIWPHSLPIHSISSHSYSFHITSFIYCSSFSLSLSLDCLSLFSLAILVHSLFHSVIPFHSIHSRTHHSLHHSILSVLNTLFSIHLLSAPYTLHYHHISFIYYSTHSTTHSSYNSQSLNTHSHYPSITLIYYSFSIPFSILYYSPQSLHLFILFIQSYHHEHSALSHTLYNSLYQSFYFDISYSLFYLSILISYYSFINTYYYSFHTHSITHLIYTLHFFYHSQTIVTFHFTNIILVISFTHIHIIILTLYFQSHTIISLSHSESLHHHSH